MDGAFLRSASISAKLHPRTIVSFVLLSAFVSQRPIALGIPPQSGEGVRESGWRRGRVRYWRKSSKVTWLHHCTMEIWPLQLLLA